MNQLLPKHYRGMPARVRVGNYLFDVEVMHASDANSNGEFGHCNIIGQKIRFAPDMSARKLANCFLHECMHAVHWLFGLTDDSKEEDFTTLGANGLCMFWQDNPEAVKWWAHINSEAGA